MYKLKRECLSVMANLINISVPTFGMEAFLLPKVKEEIVNAWFRNW